MIAHGSTTVAEIISAAGGKIVGRTRLMKMFYLLAAAGIETSFSFELRPYGPYSEDLIHAEAIARMEGAIREDEFPAGWGGKFVVFTSQTTKCRTLTKSGPGAFEAGCWKQARSSWSWPPPHSISLSKECVTLGLRPAAEAQTRPTCCLAQRPF